MHAPTTGEIVHVGKLGGFPERNLIFLNLLSTGAVIGWSSGVSLAVSWSLLLQMSGLF